MSSCLRPTYYIAKANKIFFATWSMSCKHHVDIHWSYYSHVIIGAIASQITGLTIVYSTVYSGVDQWKYQSSASLASVRGVHRWPLNSPHKWPVTRKMFPFDDVIILSHTHTDSSNIACPNTRWMVNNTANLSSQLRTCVLETIVKGSDKWLHPTDTVGFNFLSLSLILASGTQLPNSPVTYLYGQIITLFDIWSYFVCLEEGHFTSIRSVECVNVRSSLENFLPRLYRTRSVFNIKNLCSVLLFSKSVFYGCPETVFCKCFMHSVPNLYCLIIEKLNWNAVCLCDRCLCEYHKLWLALN